MLLSMMSESARAALLQRSAPISFGPGEAIFTEGSPGETMIFVQDGRVEISRMTMGGRRSVLNHVGPGEVLGEVALLDGQGRSADAIALSEVTGRVVHRRDVLAFVAAAPESTLMLIAELCSKVRNASDMFSIQSETHAPTRLAQCLLRLGEKWGVAGENGAVRIPGKFSQSDLGAFSGLARENVNRHLRGWASDRVVTLEPDALMLHRPDVLARLAEGTD
ncbi:cAMP-binding domain of CRP or a regulatory subunit of cAMP-dependent protein kinases [Poseidonocella pacifica]|uniref:cAMP-binding domain of CRP or a regulatory subunit of cAMP-dependent protein kinases n=1 Tax=Poseidonocella pacifica TaxID=871651 RepID=A0A1I0XDD0_9RHOB|nr:Crp/Fnr family transcriptional regulator [Poseidonocella pacifica]SFA98330.1 cAMP-binding domain of CRP or a regulatory subunit of cAMP-dependent protein kinases [Poseidonocella pacifica]